MRRALHPVCSVACVHHPAVGELRPVGPTADHDLDAKVGEPCPTVPLWRLLPFDRPRIPGGKLAQCLHFSRSRKSAGFHRTLRSLYSSSRLPCSASRATDLVLKLPLSARRAGREHGHPRSRARSAGRQRGREGGDAPARSRPIRSSLRRRGRGVAAKAQPPPAPALGRPAAPARAWPNDREPRPALTACAAAPRPPAQIMYCPPFAVMVEPVMKPASSETRNTTQRAISSGSPRRPTGIWGTIRSDRIFGSIARTISVPM
jgi:hypothetical protein